MHCWVGRDELAPRHHTRPVHGQELVAIARLPGQWHVHELRVRRQSSFVLQSGLNGWVATSGSFTIRGKSGTEGAAQLGETVTANITLGAHEGSATGTVYVKGSWKCG